MFSDPIVMMLLTHPSTCSWPGWFSPGSCASWSARLPGPGRCRVWVPVAIGSLWRWAPRISGPR